ncbi:MAG TPA: hypothetical protein PLV01_03585 [Candidatus Kapabacteria bacterium]|jgi:hypothetical protein|nr:hypothetical protein [Candidatus Kapabacteria bacterium]HOQ48891.1 hypothetical protein [Candidatus Kapabacteria bacterium]HPP40460.1 hypothetical protein [Candidatus Kapabacteria bacterium]HPU23783.1 hypothetical protein [Candidatus Kapabacteria bacterium]
MPKKILFFLVPVAIIIIAALLLFPKSTKYEIIDEIYDENEGGNTTFLFVAVTKLDSTKIVQISKELMQKRIIDKYKDSNIPKDEIHSNMSPDVLIAYIYNPDDTTAIPEQMKEMIQKRFSNSPILSENLAYISEGHIYTGVYYPSKKQQTLDTLSPKTVLLVPRKGVKAKDIMKKFKES